MKRILTYVVLAAVLLLSDGLLFIANWADAAGNDRISFTSNRAGNFDIYVMDVNGERLRNVTNHPTDEFGPWVPAPLPVHTWSPDGRFLAYVSGRDGSFKVYVMDTRTQKHRRLTHHHESEWSPAWSPDGKWIAFVSRDPKEVRQGKTTDHIYKTDINGADVIQLTPPGSGHGRPAWSSDSKQIAFFSHKRHRQQGLHIMNADGEKLRRVPDGNIQAMKGIFGNQCAWSPDGKQIAFSLYMPQAQREHLCVIDVDGENFRQLTRGGPIEGERMLEKREPVEAPAVPLPLTDWLPWISSPAWSPDGKWIAYVYSDRVLWQTADIYIIDAEGNGPGKPLVEGVGQDLSPAWVPEGFLSVSPGAEKQTTLWGRLKQIDK